MKTQDANGSYRIFLGFIHVILVLACLSAILPLILSVIVSISDEKSIIQHGYTFFPSAFSLSAYKIILQADWLFSAYKVTIITTVAGTFFTVLLSSMIGYAISVAKLRYRNVIAMILFIPMVFSAGLVPWYLWMTRALKLKNTLAALIVPILINPFWVFLLRNYFTTVPSSLAESAEMDGANAIRIFFTIILPLSKPILATIVLFAALNYWNNYTNALWLVDGKELYPLQYMLFKVQSLIAYNVSRQTRASSGYQVPTQSMQMATFIVTLGPIVLVYPFIQRFFVKGIMIGAIKG